MVETTAKRDIRKLNLEELKEFFVQHGEKPFRAQQVYEWLWNKSAKDFDQMTNLSVSLRDMLKTHFAINHIKVDNMQRSSDGTIKNAVTLHDGLIVESVLIPAEKRITACVSSQVGCSLACKFCATARLKRMRNLSPDEIYDQVVAIKEQAETFFGRPLTNIVFMGMGEPLANYRRVITAVRRITDPVPDGLGLSQRSVTVSTVGLVPAIRQLATEGLQVTLAVSLHTPDDELRDTLVPVNRRWKVADVLDAARHYADTTKRRVSIEYALIRDVNDQPWRAELLGRLLREGLGSLVHVNLIPLNPTPGSSWDASPLPVQEQFVARVRAAGVTCTVRDTRGREIAAACGQLAAMPPP